MKHYTTVAAALLLSAVLIFNPAAKAASISPNISGASSFYCQLINQYTVDYEIDSTDANYPFGNYNVYVYQGSFTVYINGLPVDSYINGFSSGSISLSPQIPTDCTLGSCNMVFNPIASSNLYSGGWYSSNTSMNIRAIFDDLYTETSTFFGIGTITFTLSLYKTATPYNVPDPPVSVGVSVSSSTSSNCSGTPNPSTNGLAAIIVEALESNSLPFDDILQVLEDIRTQDQTNYTTIVAYLADNDTFNSTLYTWLTTVLEDDFGALLDDTTYISSVLNAARNLINSMNSRDNLYYPIFEAALDLANTRLQTLINLMSETPAEDASMENAINQMESKQAAINDYSLPAAGNIMGNANSYVNQGSAGMNLLSIILNQPLYILILMTVISLAFVSYLLYGKGV